MLVLIIVVIVSVFPFYWMLVAASHTNGEMNAPTPPLLPGSNLFDNIGSAMQEANIPKAIINSLIVSGVVALSVVLTSTLAGFALAKLRLRGSNILLAAVVGTMMVPTQLGIIPLFMIMARLGLVGSIQSVILPSLVSAFGVYLMRQYLVTALPYDLVEAAYIDGAGTFRIFVSLVLPIARPAMAVLAMLTFMTAWNDFFWPFIVLSSTNPTVQVAIASLGQGYVHDESIIIAGTFICTLPVLAVFLLLGKQIVGGLMQGAVKG
jgi:cellobiose transport system permease protein